jgi:uncharacterized membrane protein YqgA involved in biofilm formation
LRLEIQDIFVREDDLGTIVNVIAVIGGGLIGLAFRGRVPERLTQTVLQVMGLFTALIGINMALQGQQLILVLVSLVVGTVIGEAVNIEGRLESFGRQLEKRLKVTEGSPAKGLIYASLVYCVGSMAIVGSIADGIKGDHSILYTKAVMDGIISIPFASTMGIGVLASAGSVLLYQGSLTLLAGQLKPLFSPEMIRELTAVGGIIIIGIGINILGIQKIRVGNMLPALLIIIIIIGFKGILF